MFYSFGAFKSFFLKFVTMVQMIFINKYAHVMAKQMMAGKTFCS
jgi:hypothetical protein